MSLPKLQYPINTINVPSLNKNHKFRPFLVKEEKLLLMARESQNPADTLLSIKQIVNNCSLDKLDVNKLAIFDLEYIFLKLRAISIDNIVKVSYRDNEDKEVYEFEIDLNDIKITFPKKPEDTIAITKNAGIKMKYPQATLYDDEKFLSLEKDYFFELIIRCIDTIYEGDTIYNPKDYTHQELSDFIDGLDVKTFESIQQYLLNVPKIEHVINYKNKLGNDRQIILNSLNDFFTWR